MKEIILAIIGSGGLFSGLTYLLSRRNRNNDFLGQLQKSINELSLNYTNTLNELVTVKKQNANMLVEIAKLQREVSDLKEENIKLLTRIAELKKIFNKNTHTS